MRTCVPAARACALALIVCCSWTLPSLATENLASYTAALESIRADDLQEHVTFLADDDLEGREAGSAGSKKAGNYLRSRLQRLGLRAAGVDGRYTQPFAPDHRNILGLIEGSDPDLKNQTVIVCAHYDHVGYGNEENSAGPTGQIHNGADDNASGTAAVLELAEAFTRLAEPPKRTMLFAFWDAEELEMLGAKHWIAEPTLPIANVTAVVNLDMVGRLRDEALTVYGARTAYGLRRLTSLQNRAVGLKLDFSWELEDDSDHYPFFKQGLPVLFFHSGLHDEFHSPRDDAHLVNNRGLSRVTRLTFDVLHELAQRTESPSPRSVPEYETEDYRKQLAQHVPKLLDRLGADFQPLSGRTSGARVSRIRVDSPAAKAGIRSGDRIVKFADYNISTCDELDAAVLRAEYQVSVVVQRPRRREPLNLNVELQGKPLRLGITWRSDDAEPGTVILTNVVPGSPGAEAGLQSGDHIYQVEGRDFADAKAFVRLVKEPSKNIHLLVEREGRLRTVILTLEQPMLADAA